MTERPDPCLVAMTRYLDKRRWLNRWTLLLYIFGSAVIAFCVVAIIFFIRQTWLSGAVSVIASLASGAGINWVVTRRTEAEKEERDALAEFNAQCGGKKTLVGAEGASTRVPTVAELQRSAWLALFSRGRPE
jgi:hypothetical protein